MRFGESWPAGRGRRRWVSYKIPWWLPALVVVLALSVVVEAISALARAIGG